MFRLWVESVVPSRAVFIESAQPAAARAQGGKSAACVRATDRLRASHVNRYWKDKVGDFDLAQNCPPIAMVKAIETAPSCKHAIGGMTNLPAEAAVSSVMILTGGAVFTLVANYTLERQFRIAYLLSLKDRLRQQELEGLARIDPLTGLGNRRELDHRLARLGTEADAAAPISVMMIDVDHFKSYNDGYGHLAGDQCLKQIAALVTAELRSINDSAFRFGGEEFLIVLKGTEICEAIEVAERLRQAVETAAIPHLYSGTAPILTISIGVAAAAEGRTTDIQTVVLAADGALYTAKRNGRNRVWPKPPLSAGVANFPVGRRVRSTG